MHNYQKNGKIDFLKFLFAVVIVLHHGSQKVLGLKAGYFIGGSLAVEFFFIVSGYLFMASIQRLPERTLPLGVETGRFIMRKFKGFYPEVALSFLLGFWVAWMVNDLSALELWQHTFHSAFLLNMTGIGSMTCHGEFWYLSSMLLCMMILFPLIRKYPKMMTNVVLPLTALFLLGYFCGGKDSPRNPLKWLGITFKGNIRALAEISIGVCLYPLVEKLRKINFSIFGRILITVVEWGCYISFIRYMYAEKASLLDYYYILLCTVAILLSFNQRGIDANWFQSRFFGFLGKVSFPLYLAHHSWAANINTFLPEAYSGKKRYVIYLALAALSTVAIMLASIIIRKLGTVLKNPAKKLLLAKEKNTVS